MPEKDNHKHLQAAAARALSHNCALNVAENSRAQADKAAFWGRFHSRASYNNKQSPAMDALEQARVNAVGARQYKGARENLINSQAKTDEFLLALSDEVFCFLIGGKSKDKNLTQSIKKYFQDVDIQNQKEYEVAAYKLLCDLGLNESENQQNKEEESEKDEQNQKQREESQQSQENLQETSKSGKNDTNSAPLNGCEFGDYKIYTKEFDKIVRPSDVAGFAELSKLRADLDKASSPHRKETARLANKLSRLLASRTQTRWVFDQEEGALDSTKFARLIARPKSHTQIFKQEITENNKDTVVSLLIDNSGSMRGKPIALAAISAELMASALERCGIGVEILGFTTSEWKGGKARAKWLENDCPENPGRLNEILHIIYKNASTPWRRARQGLGLMLREGLLKENIDGEALLWAYSRICKLPQKRKILIVVSDGAPIDDASLSANNSNFLEAHLKNVIKAIEARRGIELAAIGIGHDVGKYYSNSTTIKHADGLGAALACQLEKILTNNSKA